MRQHSGHQRMKEALTRVARPAGQAALLIVLALCWVVAWREWLVPAIATCLAVSSLLLDHIAARITARSGQCSQPHPNHSELPGSQSIDDFMATVLGQARESQTLEVNSLRDDLYRLQSFNNQLIRLGEIAQELNTALPFRETKAKALELTRQLLSADVVALVSERGGEFTLEGVYGCEARDVNVDCCGYYARCPVRTSFRDLKPAVSTDEKCATFPPTLRSRLSLPFRMEDGRVMSLLAAAASPDAFADLAAPVMETLLGHIRTGLQSAQKYDAIRRDAVTDPLTNLYNRRCFEKRGKEEVERSLRHQEPLTLLMFDVDHFKRINDTYGHQTGDKVLQSVAQYLKDSIRTSDICGRYGGEEFALLLPATAGRNAGFLADRLRSGLGQIMYTGLGLPRNVSVTVSAGLATCPHDGTTLDELVAQADKALYRAKESGRDRVIRATAGV